MLTNMLVNNSEYLDPNLFPKKTDTIAPTSGKKTIRYSILSF